MANEQEMVISVMDRDRPGIVAEVTEGIGALGGNLADLRESVLCGYFTMILVAGFPVGTTTEQVKAILQKGTSSEISVKLADEPRRQPADSGNAYILSAVGRDRVGLVAQMSRFCCDRGVNILDLASHVEGDQYTMMLQVDLPDVGLVERFEKELSAFGRASGLDIALQHNDIFRATNEI